eukprot:5622078-Karenia_brevis.AAC.1
MCKRSFANTPNPRKIQLSMKPLLQRRYPRSLVCASCPGFIAKHRIGQNQEDVLKELEDNDKQI